MLDMRVKQQPSRREILVGREKFRGCVKKFSIFSCSRLFLGLFGASAAKGISCSFGKSGKLLLLAPAITN